MRAYIDDLIKGNLLKHDICIFSRFPEVRKRTHFLEKKTACREKGLCVTKRSNLLLMTCLYWNDCYKCLNKYFLKIFMSLLLIIKRIQSDENRTLFFGFMSVAKDSNALSLSKYRYQFKYQNKNKWVILKFYAHLDS